MYPIILERDNHIVDWDTRLAGWPTTASSPNGEAYYVRTDGLLYVNYGTMDVSSVSGPAAGAAECVGLYITNPQETDEFTPYAISAVAWSEDHLIRPFLFIGVAPASITSDAAGDLLSKCRIIGVSDPVDSWGSGMEKDVTIAVAKMPAGLEARALCIGIGMSAGTVNSANDNAWARLSVRRLIGNAPAIIDTRKL